MAELKASEHSMTSWDGAELFYRAWLPRQRTDKALLLFHRGHEHSARWQEVVERLDLPDVAVFAWDARGHGRSPGQRGSAESISVLTKDVEAFVRHVATEHGIPTENTVVMAHSVGAVTVAAWVHDFAPPIRGLVLATPAFRVRLYVPFAIPLLRARQALLGDGYVKSYVKARMLTHDAGEADRYARDELIFRQIAVNVLLDLHDTSSRLLDDAAAIDVPTLMLVAGSDWVVDIEAQRRFFDGLSSPVKEIHTYPGFFHAIFHERDRRRPIADARRFIRARLDAPVPRRSLVDADRSGPTQAEFDRLQAPGGGPQFAVARWFLKSVGRLSSAVKLGWRAGFDSGVMLDYVYENRPQGVTPLGRLIDRAYLGSIGWRGIRLRRQHMERTLRTLIERLHAEGRTVHLLDIASGPGRYLLETIGSLRAIPMTALLRDYKPENIAAGRRLAGELELTNVTFEEGDAFDRAALARLRPRPSVAVVSGLFELFPDNAPVRESLQGLADVIEPGGYLIYTNQPYHPQLEFIARVLTNREGRAWIMRRRSQAEMDELVRAAGFTKLGMEIDRWGIFTVSTARRLPA